MDPTANLVEQLKLAERINLSDSDNIIDDLSAGERLAELVLALHEWMSKGGFPPEQWKRSDK